MSEFEEQMKALRAKYAVRVAQDDLAIAAAVSAGDWGQVRSLAHGLAGTGAIFGFPGITQCARKLEDAIDAGKAEDEREALTRQLREQLAAAAQAC